MDYNLASKDFFYMQPGMSALCSPSEETPATKVGNLITQADESPMTALTALMSPSEEIPVRRTGRLFSPS